MNARRMAIIALAFCGAMAVTIPGRAQQMGWPRGGTSTADQILASPLVADLNGDGRMEIIVASCDDRLYVYDHAGRAVTGWPQTLGFGDGSIASAALGDVDGDGAPEIVVAGDDTLSRNAAVKVYETNGTLRASRAIASVASAKATPCLIDCYLYSGPSPGNRHAAEEILLRDGDGLLHVLYWNGAGLSGFCNGTSLYQTVTSDTLKDRYGAQRITSSVAAVGEGTSVTKIVVGSTDSRVYLWTVSSTPSANWTLTKLTPCTVADRPVRFMSSPALMDLNGDGQRDIVIGGGDGRMYVWNGDGSGAYLPGWPRDTLERIDSSPAVADVDLDGNLDVVVGSNDGYVYAWDRLGNLLPGWPAATNGEVLASAVAADLDRDTTGSEVVAASTDGYVYAWSRSGAPLPGWPKRMNTPIVASPALANLHGGDRLAIVVAGYNGRIFVWDLAQRSGAGPSGWRQFRGGGRRQGYP